MINTLRLLLISQLKRCKLTPKASGFTLIELLVAMVISAMVLAPLFRFMLDIMESDRMEQAQANSEQELQSSLDYIAQDLQQAIYIYDGEGITAIKGELAHKVDNTKVPVLVFWKRQVVENAIKFDGEKCTAKDIQDENCNDRFVYSLVAYYLIKDNDTTWSGATRIGRFEIKDGIQNPNAPLDINGNPQYIEGENTQPDKGFKRFNLQAEGTTLKEKMNQWQADEDNYTQDTRVLVDFIDQSTKDVPKPVDCSDALGLDPKVVDDTLLVPPSSFDKLKVNEKLKTNSFYACVDSSRTLAQVYIRGNALARIYSKDEIDSKATYDKSREVYFPTANVQLKGRGFLGGE